jgi:hypothetical protein
MKLDLNEIDGKTGLSWEGETEFFGCSNGLSVNCREGLDTEIGEDKDNFDQKISNKIFDQEESLKYYRGEVPEEVSHYDPFPGKSGNPWPGYTQN